MASQTPTKSRLNHPPTAVASRPLGWIRKFADDPLATFAELQRDYGDAVRIRYVGPVHGYLFYHPDHFKHVLVDNARNYTKMPTPSFQVLVPLIGNGLLTSDGDFWLRQRRLAAPAFHRKRIADFAQIMQDSTQAMLDRWDTFPAGHQFNVQEEMSQLALDIVGKALFGIDLSGESAWVNDAVDEVSEQISRLSVRPTASFELKIPFLPSTRQLNETISKLDTLVEAIIAERRNDPTDRGDLLSMFMLTEDADTGERMSDKQLRDEVMTMVLAGHETTAVSLTWTFYLLSQNKAIADRLKAEVDAKLAGELPTFETMSSLEYTDRVIKETLRCYPPAYVLPRTSAESDTVGGYDVAKGAMLTLSTYDLHHHADFWDEPDKFDPDRFLPDAVKARHRYAYVPFGAGPRMCIGAQFAQMEAQLILPMILQRFDVNVPEGHVAEIEPLITLRPKDGIPVTITPR